MTIRPCSASRRDTGHQASRVNPQKSSGDDECPSAHARHSELPQLADPGLCHGAVRWPMRTSTAPWAQQHRTIPTTTRMLASQVHEHTRPTAIADARACRCDTGQLSRARSRVPPKPARLRRAAIRSRPTANNRSAPLVAPNTLPSENLINRTTSRICSTRLPTAVTVRRGTAGQRHRHFCELELSLESCGPPPASLRRRGAATRSSRGGPGRTRRRAPPAGRGPAPTA